MAAKKTAKKATKSLGKHVVSGLKRRPKLYFGLVWDGVKERGQEAYSDDERFERARLRGMANMSGVTMWIGPKRSGADSFVIVPRRRG